MSIFDVIPLGILTTGRGTWYITNIDVYKMMEENNVWHIRTGLKFDFLIYIINSDVLIGSISLINDLSGKSSSDIFSLGSSCDSTHPRFDMLKHSR